MLLRFRSNIFGLVFVFISLTLVRCNYEATEEDVRCFSYDSTCKTCIQEPGCQWCAESNENKTEHHCFSVNSDLSHFCLQVENPLNSPLLKVKDRNLTDLLKKNINIDYDNIIQLRPQHVELRLRKGVPINFTVSYRQVTDYPLDLYYLMDLSKSMLEDKNTLAHLGKNLADRMRNLTSQFKIGFGSFVDKVMLPFVNIHPTTLNDPCNPESCATPFSFKNNLKLTERDDEFVKQVRAAQISINLDSPEGGFDALMQAMVCEKEIGWRKNVRKIIIFSTDAIFHAAGDGKLAGVVMPNDGKCHLNAEGYYDKYDVYDYPSIGHIDEVAREKGINLIFAVKGHRDLYKNLANQIKDASYGELSARSNNVIDLVAQVYNSITDKVEMGVKSKSRESPVSFRFFTDCGIQGGEIVETSVCNNVKEGTNFDFTVEMQVTNCPKNGNGTTRVVLGTLQDSLIVDVDLLCTCKCESDSHKGYKTKSPKCSRSGTRQCEICICDPGFYGEHCQCSRDKIATGTENDQNKCRPEGSDPDASVCSGRGRCECETCICWKEKHNGKFCQCDRGMCQQHINSDVECSGNGRCDCNSCVCNPGWEGQFCECRSRQSCIPKGGGDVCSGNGDCICGKCECNVPHTGKFCEECPTCGEGKCLEFRPCVQCDVWNSGELRGEKCKNCTYGKINTLENLDAQLSQWALLCTFEDETTGCDFNFTYKYTDESYDIAAQNTQKCPEKIDILAVTFGVICGIVAIGVLTLIIWKILTTIHDRREFMRFENESKNAAWNAEGNPLYKSPTTTVSNPAFSTK